MSSTLKFLIGLLAVGLLTWLCLGPFGHAQTIADDLESRTLAAIEAEGAQGVEVSIPRNPVSRTIHLSGDLPDDVKRRISEIALGQPGVANVVWDEPEAPEAPSAEAIADCESQLATLVSEETIQFQSGSAYINPASERLLDRIGETASSCEGMAIEISGHTDSSGSEAINRELSAARANAVRNALVERGLSEDALSAVGKANDEPLGDNPADPANRRIEFDVTAAGEQGEG